MARMNFSNNQFAQQATTPRDAAAIILLRDQKDPKVFWVKRAQTLNFMAGYHAFPGGQRDAADSDISIALGGVQEPTLCVTAIRELFEETGVLIARDMAQLSAEKLAAMRAELITNQTTFKELTERESFTLDTTLLQETPRWITPAHLPRRFDTRFYTTWLPDGQEAEVIPGELESG